MRVILTIILSLLLDDLLFAQLNYGWATNPKTDFPIPGNVEGRGIKIDSSGNIYIAGAFSGTADFDPGPGIYHLTSIGMTDVYIAKYSSAGNLIWAKSFGGNSSDFAGNPFFQNCLALDASNNFYVSGSFTDTADFDPSPAVSNLISLNPNNFFVAKYDSSGNFIFAINSIAADFAIASDKYGDLYVAGSLIGITDFDPGPGITNLTSLGGVDVFIAKYDSQGNLVYAKNVAEGLNDAHCYGLTVDSIGNAIITGNVYGTLTDFDPGPGIIYLNAVGNGASDAFIAKYDVQGNYIYANRIGGQLQDVGAAISVDKLGYIYVTGHFTDAVDFDPGNSQANLISYSTLGHFDSFIAKYDSIGNYIYARNLGSPSGVDNVQSFSLTNDVSGNVFITGYFTGTADFDPGTGTVSLTANGYQDVFISSLDSLGNYKFALACGGNLLTYCCDNGTAVDVDNAGNIFATGMFKGTGDFDPGPGTANLTAPSGFINSFFSKYSYSGAYVYASSLGGYGNVIFDDEGKDIVYDKLGNIYATGSFSGRADFDASPDTTYLNSSGAKDVFLAKYDTSGKLLFAKGIGSNLDDEGRAISIANDGNIIISGCFQGQVDFDPGISVFNLTSVGSSDIFLAKYDTAGNYIFSKSIGGKLNDVVNSIATDNIGNVYAIGHFSDTTDFDPGIGAVNLISSGQNDIFFAKYDTAGNYVYANSIGAPWYDEGTSIACDKIGNIHITGVFAGTADFDPGAGNSFLTSGAGDDVFLAKYDSSGKYVFSKCLVGSNGLNVASSLKVDSIGNAYICGEFHKTVDFDPGPGAQNFTAAGFKDAFLAKYDSSGNYLFALQLGSTGTDRAQSIALDKYGNLYLTGIFSGITDFEPGSGASTLVPSSSKQIFLAKYDSIGTFVFAKQIGNGTDCAFNSIVSDQMGGLFGVGFFSNMLDVDPNSGTVNLLSSNSSDILIAKYQEGCSIHSTSANGNSLYINEVGGAYRWVDCNNGDSVIAGEMNQTFFPSGSGNYAAIVSINGCVDTTMCLSITLVGVNSIQSEKLISIFPNPAASLLNIVMPDRFKSEVIMLNLHGGIVYANTHNNPIVKLNLENIPSGIYIVRIKTDEETEFFKIAILK